MSDVIDPQFMLKLVKACFMSVEVIVRKYQAPSSDHICRSAILLDKIIDSILVMTPLPIGT